MAILFWQQTTRVQQRSLQLCSSYLREVHNYSGSLRKSISSFIDAVDILQGETDDTNDRIYERRHVTRFRTQNSFGVISRREYSTYITVPLVRSKWTGYQSNIYKIYNKTSNLNRCELLNFYENKEMLILNKKMNFFAECKI